MPMNMHSNISNTRRKLNQYRRTAFFSLKGDVAQLTGSTSAEGLQKDLIPAEGEEERDVKGGLVPAHFLHGGFEVLTGVRSQQNHA